METHAGQTYGNYILDHMIGQGGMGSVYLATHRVLGTRAAVKLLVKNARDTRYRDRFFREAKQAFELIHVNVVRVLDAGYSEAEGGTCYLAMEYIEGKTLRAHLNARCFTPADAMPVFLSLMDALATAHTTGIVHRDVKPDNIIVDKTGRPMLTDFGIARGVEDATEITSAGEILGTPPYMPLEQWDSGAVDARIDQYALGVVFYEMLTQKLPIEADKPSGYVIALVSNKRVPIRTRQPDVPAYLEALVERMMAIRAADRFPNLQAAYDFLMENAPQGQIRPGTARLPRFDTPVDGMLVHTSVTPASDGESASATLDASAISAVGATDPTVAMPARARRPGSGLHPQVGDVASTSDLSAARDGVRGMPGSGRRPSARLSHARRANFGVNDGARRASIEAAAQQSALRQHNSRNRQIVITLCCLIVAAAAATILILTNVAAPQPTDFAEVNRNGARVTTNQNETADPVPNDNAAGAVDNAERRLDVDFAGGKLPDAPSIVVMPAASYTVARTLVVPSGVTLRIESGAALAFAPDAGLHCEGALEVSGTSGRPVRFTPQDRTARWRNLTVTGPDATARLAFLELDRANGARGAFDSNLVFRRDGEFESTHGGGVLIGDGAVVTMADCTVRDCQLEAESTQIGAGIYIRGSPSFESSLTMARCHVQNNRATGHGGGLAVGSRTTVVLTECEFVSNAAVGSLARGGGLRVVGDTSTATVTATDCVFASNQALGGGNVSAEGNASLTLIDPVIELGRAGSAGAGMLINSRLPGESTAANDRRAVARITGGAIRSNNATDFAGGVAAVGNVVVVLDGVTLSANHAANGGAILVYGEAGITRDAPEPTFTAIACGITQCTATTEGGAIYVLRDGRATLRDCTISSCEAQQGAAISIASVAGERSTASIEGGVINDNTAGAYGAIFASGPSDLQLLDVTLADNEGVTAGGAWVTVGTAAAFATMRATNCTFRGNRSPQGAGGFAGAYSTVTLRECVFTENSGALGAGLTVASLFNDPDSNPTTCALDGCRFVDNTANDGAGLYVGNRGQATVAGCTFRGNIATEAGGGLLVLADARLAGGATLRDTTFEDNAADRGGAVGLGGNVTCEFARCTFHATNTAATGPAILGGGAGSANAQLTLTANVFEAPEPVVPVVVLARQVQFDDATLGGNGLDATTFARLD